MNRYPLSRRCRRVASRSLPARTADRRGSVLLVVIGLLGLLLLVGFTYFSFAAMEDNAAQYYSEGSKVETDAMSVDVMWDWALRQIILGAPQEVTISPLWAPPNSNSPPQLPGNGTPPGRHSLVGNLLGIDFSIYNGLGVNVIRNASGQPQVDQNFDGIADNNSLLMLNYSAAAQTNGVAPTVPFFPSPDVDYTYPDFNNIFLAYKGETMDSAGNVYKVIIPSYHRPQLLRNIGAGWQTSANTGAAAPVGSMKILRPHPSHVIPGTNGTVYRFINSSEGVVNNVLAQPIAPFPFTVDNNGDSTPGEMGIFSNTVGGAAGALRLDYDKDNDGDGIKEGIYMDFGFPAQDLPDGRKYVPIFSVTIYDADALINLNTAGNLAGLMQLNSPMTQPFGQTNTAVRPLSRSNQGLSAPSEINPWWALDANPSSDLVGDPTATFEQYRKFFGQNPSSQAEMANMDLFYHLIGRPEYNTTTTPSRYLAGRWGELTRLSQFVNTKNTNNLPWPGYSGSDDDSDRNEGEYGYATPAGYGSTLNGIVPPFGQPLDFRGGGTFFDLTGGGIRPRMVGYSSLPGRWMQYIDFQSRGTNPPSNEIYGTAYRATTAYGVNQMMQQMNGDLTSPGSAVSAGTNYLTDHPSETIVDPRYTRLQNSVESIYDASEMQIHRSPNDADYASISSRLKSLMPFNFDSSARASEIRQRFTTISWDRSNPGFGAGNTNRTWEWNADINGNVVTPGGGININIPGSEFPPVFGTLTTVGAGTPNLNEPFRRELRRLLEMEQGAQLSGKKQLRLNINKLLTSNDNQAAPGSQIPNYSNLQLKYRDLTPHPTGLSANPVPTSPSTSQPAVGMSAADQEFWARKDRQQMARDIFVMLYTLGGGQDGVNYTTLQNAVTAAGPPVQRQLYSDWQLREMAQFAVNLVDSLDRDNVITKFEYPKDLSQGWTVNSTPLDDNPFTNEDTPLSPSNPQYDSRYPEDGLYRGVVYGVEAAQLTISEVLPLMCRNTMGPTGMPQDHQGTEYDETKNKLPTDTNAGRYFMYVELRNASQFPVPINNGEWQIRLSYNPRDPSGTGYLPAVEKTLTIRDTNNSQVGTGGLYLVGATDTDNIDPMAMKQRPSVVRLNQNWNMGGGTFLQYVPNLGYFPNLDVSTANTTLYSLADVSSTQLPPTTPNVPTSNPTPIDWHEWFTNADPDRPMTVTLCRRMHPGRDSIYAFNQQQEYDNPWVTVDVQRVPGQSMPLAGTKTIPYFDASDPNATDNSVFVTNMNQIRTLERPQPLDSYSSSWNANASMNRNSLGTVNYTTTTLGGSFTLWQPHFDRDFASIAELFSIPLYGPDQLTQKFAINGKPAFDVYQSPPSIPDTDTPFRVSQAKILQPQHPSNVGAMGGGSTQLDNRWYRLFELIEVPSRMHQNAQITKDINATSPSPRVPGKININTIRTPSVLYALLDDPYLFNLTGNPNQPVNDSHDGARNWWYQLLRSRDGQSTVNGLTMPLPGMPPIFNGTVLSRRSQPFRGFGFMGTGPVGGTVNGPSQSIEHTLFRSLLLDGTDDTVVGRARRRLFEVGNQTEHNNATIDPYTRHRLLSKILGNTTTRSNVFLVWISVDFFEAVEVPYGTDQVIRVGGPLNPPLPGHRMFGVIDRSIAEQTYKSGTGFNYKQMVLFQKTIE